LYRFRFELLRVQTVVRLMLVAAPFVYDGGNIAHERFFAIVVQCVVHTLVLVFVGFLLVHVFFAIRRIHGRLVYTTFAATHDTRATRTRGHGPLVFEIQMSSAINLVFDRHAGTRGVVFGNDHPLAFRMVFNIEKQLHQFVQFGPVYLKGVRNLFGKFIYD
jgi:hypothetical protein